MTPISASLDLEMDSDGRVCESPSGARSVHFSMGHDAQTPPPFVSAMMPRTGSTVAQRSIEALLANDLHASGKSMEDLFQDGFESVVLQEKVPQSPNCQ